MTEDAIHGSKYRTILGVRFFTGTAGEAVEIGLDGGLVVVPAAPALCDLEFKRDYREALASSDLAIADSGLMVLVWRWLTGDKLERISGLEYLRLLLERAESRQPGAALWVMPTAAARDRNLAWLRSHGQPTAAEDCYLAPNYPDSGLEDQALLELVRGRRPAQIIVCLGGGTQERLGFWLKQRLDYRPGIHCTGAAIGFLSGEQINIPPWADYWYLGWLFRSLSEPRKFLPRYWRARKLVGMMLRYREKSPGG